MTNLFADVIEPAQATEALYGVPASVTLAQWALESDYGKRMPEGSNNPFGIKATPGHPFVECETHEVTHGISHKVVAKFAQFDNLSEAFEAHGALLHNGHYAKALSHEGDANAFAKALTGVYATDPEYGFKLISIMKQHSLYQYNKKGTLV